MTTRTVALQSIPARLVSAELAPSNFPKVASAFKPSPKSTVTHLLEKAREYERQEGTGNVIERTRARSIAAAYARTACLLEELEALRLQALKKEATMAGSSR